MALVAVTARPSQRGRENYELPDQRQQHAVTFTVTDNDAGAKRHFTVTVDNVAPTATLGNNGPMGEGAPAPSASAARPTRPAWTGGRIRYAFGCATATSPAPPSGRQRASTSCTFGDNGTYTVKGRIIDKDGGFTQYTTNVTVNNVAPSVPTLVAPAEVSKRMTPHRRSTGATLPIPPGRTTRSATY